MNDVQELIDVLNNLRRQWEGQINVLKKELIDEEVEDINKLDLESLMQAHVKAACCAAMSRRVEYYEAEDLIKLFEEVIKNCDEDLAFLDSSTMEGKIEGVKQSYYKGIAALLINEARSSQFKRNRKERKRTSRDKLKNIVYGL